ncbi:MAG: bifunctional demethylmenaquinone methyltransferase/2-methoxy-6-polyprenyl-1,4-benzoquinol methylase UbiE [Pseudomonadota bacterium]|nr:bifunctional demethylmenaquinone methyltransferase/2-methoxy-6-polyprenyl-1,4-benzoquinol methylase UbiE [Pseudomonadota bacterium]
MKNGKTTTFGFREVSREEKPNLVKGVFTSVAPKYDLMNDLMSLGAHRIWKEAMIDWLAPRPGQRLLDVAGGTGDIALKFLSRTNGQSSAVILDLTENMLREGKRRIEATEYNERLEWICGDALSLPFKEKSFDVYSISFGIRNVSDIEKALFEAFRVLKTGGRIMVLEFGKLSDDLLQSMYDTYSFSVIPRLGGYIAGDSKSYRYLVESIRRFPAQEDFSEKIRNVGFKNVKYRNLSFGVAAIHSAWKI